MAQWPRSLTAAGMLQECCLTTSIVLIRHGQTEHNNAGLVAGWTDSPLSDVGRIQARYMATHVAASYPCVALYASPLQRALDTARALAATTGLTPTLEPDLREQHFGEMEGLTNEQIRVLHPAVASRAMVVDDVSFTWPGGEQRAAFFARTRRALDRIIEAHPGQTVAVVTHGGVIGALVADVEEGKPWLWRRYLVLNCAVTVLHDQAGKRSLGIYDDTSFLPDFGADPLTQSLAQSRPPSER